MRDREKLIEILRVPIYPHELADPAEVVADYLLDNGVTFATDIVVGGKWIPVTERLPERFASYIVYRKSNFGGHFSMLRYSPALGWHFYDSEWGDVTVENVTHWMPLPEPPKE